MDTGKESFYHEIKTEMNGIINERIKKGTISNDHLHLVFISLAVSSFFFFKQKEDPLV